jgi:hypothetical protein
MRWNLWDRTAYMWHKRQRLYAIGYIAIAAVFFYHRHFIEGLLAFILAEIRISRKEQRYG